MPIKFLMSFRGRLQFIYRLSRYKLKKTIVFSQKLKVISDIQGLRNITLSIIVVIQRYRKQCSQQS